MKNKKCLNDPRSSCLTTMYHISTIISIYCPDVFRSYSDNNEAYEESIITLTGTGSGRGPCYHQERKSASYVFKKQYDKLSENLMFTS